MANPQHQIPTQIQSLRAYELRLLRSTFASPAPNSSSPSPAPSPSSSDDTRCLLNHLLYSIKTGKYLEALSSDAAKLVVGAGEPPNPIYSELLERVEQFIGKQGSVDEEEGRACRAIVVMCVAVAAFFCFIQCNITGPVDELLPQCPPLFKASEFMGWDDWARNHLLSHGSQLLAKFSNLQYLVLAKMLVMGAKDLVRENLSSLYEIRSISWWFARILLMEQRILDELSSSLFDLLQVSMAETLNHFGSLEQVTSYWGLSLHHDEALDIVSMAHLEAGTVEYTYGRVDSCRVHFQSAEVAAGLQLAVTGVLGYRTIHQIEPKAQRVLVDERSSSNIGGPNQSLRPSVQENNDAPKDNLHLDRHELLEDSDILKMPVLLGHGNESGSGAQDNQNSCHGDATPLKAIQQAVVLAWCLLIEISTRHDELQRWDMAPFIEAIDSQPSSFFMLQCLCNLLRIRWELTRNRTKARALGMMEKLVESVHNPMPGVAQRIPFCYVANIPTIPALQKEYGEILVSLGLVGEAIRVFERLELWDNLIYCNRLLGKKAAAVELIKRRLSETANDPRLWCSLGDVTNNDSCYEKALEVSNNKSVRAKRSLARSAYDRGDYETSKVLWESAMAMNSLYPDGWFALGAAALKAGDVEKALVGFTQAVKLDPGSGEAWNNIACVHMVKKRSKEAFIAFQEAMKFKRDSWQMWENYSHVAMDVGNVHQALEAVQMVLHISNSRRIDMESFTKLLERIVLEIEDRASSKHSIFHDVTHDSVTPETCLDDSQEGSESKLGSRVELSRETEHLVDLLGKILQQIVKNGSGADMWGLYARWHKIKGDLTMCSEALLKQVRSYQGSDLWKDRDRFKRFAHASLELCKVYMEISSSSCSRRELVNAEMHLRNIVKQGQSFSDTEEFRDLQACLDEVKIRLQSDVQK